MWRYPELTAARRAAPLVKRKYVDMRLPVNPRSLTVLSGSSSVQAGGHMDSALDHADIRGFEPHISVGPEVSLKLGARLQMSHNVIEDLSGVSRPPACMTDYRAGPRLPVMSPHTKPESSRAVATTAVCAPFLAEIVRKVRLSRTCAAHE